MQVKTILDYLAEGELNGTGLVDYSTQEIKLTSISRVISLIQLALNDLYTRFPLKERELRLMQDENTTLYRLHSDHAVSNTSSTAQKYIDDADNPFTDDIIILQSLWDEGGNEVPLNNSMYEGSYFTPAPNALQIPEPVTGNTTFIMYRAAHTKLTGQVNQEVEFPDVALDAVLKYVAYRYYSSMQGAENQTNSLNFHAQYENSCNFLQRYIVMNNATDLAMSKFETNNWP